MQYQKGPPHAVPDEGYTQAVPEGAPTSSTKADPHKQSQRGPPTSSLIPGFQQSQEGPPSSPRRGPQYPKASPQHLSSPRRSAATQQGLISPFSIHLTTQQKNILNAGLRENQRGFRLYLAPHCTDNAF